MSVLWHAETLSPGCYVAIAHVGRGRGGGCRGREGWMDREETRDQGMDGWREGYVSYWRDSRTYRAFGKVTLACREKSLHCERTKHWRYGVCPLAKPRKSRIYLWHFKCLSKAGNKYDRARWYISTAQLSGSFNIPPPPFHLKTNVVYLCTWCSVISNRISFWIWHSLNISDSTLVCAYY